MELQIFADISKVDDEKRMVYGYASTTALDNQGEMIKREALIEALPDYLKYSNIREMHQPSAVGVAEEVNVDDKGIYLCAKIEDEKAWSKVKSKVYKGFSIGGKSLSKVDNVIERLRISEISLVDRPANPECLIEIYKAEGMENVSKVAERDDVNPKEGKEKYGDVKFADEKNKKYPIDSEEHIRAAWNYINKSKNAGKYSSSDASAIKSKILAAWKDKIGGEPPSAKEDTKEKSEKTVTLKKGMYAVACFANLIDAVNDLRRRCEAEAAFEGDASPIPDKLKEAVVQLSDIFKEMAAEETAELTEDEDESNPVATPVTYAEKPKDIEKAGARNSKADQDKVQKMHDLAMELGAECGDHEDNEEGDDEEKSETVSDIQKIESLEQKIAKVELENDELKKAMEEWKNQPLPMKGKAMVVQKTDDYISKNDTDIKNVESPTEIIKMLHRKPVAYTEFVSK